MGSKHGRLIGALFVFVAGCHFGLTPESWQRKLERSDALERRGAAIASGDFAAVVAYDDLVITHSVHDVPVLRRQRQAHFAKLVEQTYAKVDAGEPLSQLIELIALRHEAQRTDRDEWRAADLAETDAEAIAPRFTALAPQVWSVVDQISARGDYAQALQIAAALADELATDDAAARLAELRATASDFHLGLAETGAARSLYGAQVLHAKIGFLFGGDPGELATPPDELRKQTEQAWTVLADGGCLEGLADQLASSGFTAGAGEPLQLAIAFDGCEPATRTWETSEAVPYRIARQVEIKKPRTEMHCTADKETVERVEHVDVIRTTTTVEKGSCTEVETGEYYVDHVEEMLVDEVAYVPVQHRIDSIHASGTITLTSESGVRDARFDLTSESYDDQDWGSGVPAGGTQTETHWTHTGKSEDSAREGLFTQLRGEAWTVAKGYLEERAAGYVAAGQQAAAAGDTLAADDAYYIASQITFAAGTVRPELSQWIAATYTIPSDILALALTGGAMPKLTATPEQAVQLPSAYFSSDAAVQTFRSILTISVTAGVTGATPEGDTKALTGAGAAFHVDVMGLGFRMNGGTDGDGNGLIDFDFYGGYGGWLGFLHVEPLVGLGLDATPGNDDYLTPGPGSFKLPVGAYAELGGLASYAFLKFVKLELMYTKAFRTSSGIPQQKRLDLRVILKKLAITARYSEYLSDGDGLSPAFGADGRAAKMWSVLGGFGF